MKRSGSSDSPDKTAPKLTGGITPDKITPQPDYDARKARLRELGPTLVW